MTLGFTGKVSSNWNDNTLDGNSQAILFTNWTGDIEPAAGDDVVIGGVNQSFQVTMDTSVYLHTNIADVVNTLGVAASSSLTISGSASPTFTNGITNNGTITISGTDITHGGKADVGGAIHNGGHIIVSGGYLRIIPQVGATTVALDGATGTLEMTAGSFLTGASNSAVAVLENFSTIQGAGLIGSEFNTFGFGGGYLILDNHGIVDATDDNSALTINPETTAPVNDLLNDGTLEASGLGGLIFNGTRIDQAPNGAQGSKGTIGAFGNGTHVDLNNVVVRGGYLATSGTGFIQASGVQPNADIPTTTLDGSDPNSGPVFNTGNLAVLDGQTLDLKGTITNSGILTIHATGHSAVLTVDLGDVTLNGGGHVQLIKNPNDYFANAITGVSNTTATTLHNVDNTISGIGTIGASLLNLDNQASGVIDADQPSDQLTLVSSQISNAGTLEATAGGDLILQGNTVVQNDNGVLGTIGAFGDGSHVDLDNTIVRGGYLKTSGTGYIQSSGVQPNASIPVTTLDGSDPNFGVVRNTGNLDVLDGQTLNLKGGLTNTGILTLHATGHSATLTIDLDGVTLDGSGHVQLVKNPDDYFANAISGVSNATATTLHNVDNTISGIGTIGGSLLDLDNQASGIVDADQPTDQMTLTSPTISNAGTLESSNGGHLIFQGDTVTQSGNGAIAAYGDGSRVDLDNMIVRGGTLATTGTGYIQSSGNQPNAPIPVTTLDGGSAAGAVHNTGSVMVLDGQTLELLKTITNTGSITLHATGHSAELLIGLGDVTLDGGGHVVMAHDAGGYNTNLIAGVDSATPTTLHNNNTISGAGTIGGNGLMFDNQVGGTINADNSDAQLILNTGTPILTNAGTIEATGAAGLLIQVTTIDGTSGGTLLAADGSHIDLKQAGIVGGTLQSMGTGYFQTTDSLNIIAGATLSATIKIVGSTAIQIGGAIDNTGTILVDGTTGFPTLKAGGTWTGGGHIDLADASSSALNVNGTWSSDNIISGAGTMSGTGNGATFTNTGTVEASFAAHSLTIDTTETVTNNGILEANIGTLIVNDVIAGSGHAIIAGGGMINFNADFQENVDFQGGAAAGSLQLAHAYTGTVSGFASNDKIDLSFLSWMDGDHATFAENGGNTGGTLTILDSGNTTLATLTFAGQYTTGQFSVGDDGQGHVQVSGATPHAPTQTDYSGDGHGDVLFIQPGVNFDSDYQWQMNDRAIVAQGGVDLFDKTFSVQVTGDFNGDGKADVLFENPTTAGVWEWQLNGTGIASQGAVDVADTSFHILGTADFNGDGMSDLLWRNDTTGLLYQWQMNGTHDTGAALGALDSSVWHAVGAGDFTGDGKADILFHYQNGGNAADPANGAFDIWQMDGSAVTATLGVERPDASWQILGVGDFNGDGISDIAIRNVSATPDNGAVWVYLMAGTITTHADSSKTADILAQGPAGIADAATWHVQEIADLNGDGKDDILFRNDAGYFYSWDMNGTTIGSEGSAGTEAGNWADPSLHVIGQHWDIA